MTSKIPRYGCLFGDDNGGGGQISPCGAKEIMSGEAKGLGSELPAPLALLHLPGDPVERVDNLRAVFSGVIAEVLSMYPEDASFTGIDLLHRMVRAVQPRRDLGRQRVYRRPVRRREYKFCDLRWHPNLPTRCPSHRR